MFSICAGTIFGDSKLPLRKGFTALYSCNSKRSVSSRQLAADVGVTQKTAARFMLQRIRGSGEAPASEQIAAAVEPGDVFPAIDRGN